MAFMQGRRRRYLKRIAKFHGSVTVVFFMAYVLCSLFLSPEFLITDVRNKFSAVADTITLMATVLGPPEKPIVTGTAICNNGVLRVDLDWADDENTYTYDIERDSLPLITGLAPSSYSDAVVELGTSYLYTVTANGPTAPGTATSDPVTVLTPSKCAMTRPVADVTITTFQSRGITEYSGIPDTSDKTPLISGTTNIPEGKIAITVQSDTTIFDSVYANSNGYWSWTPSANLSRGTYTVTVSVIDTEDPFTVDADSLIFKIVKKEEEEDSNKRSTKETVKKSPFLKESIPQVSKKEIPPFVPQAPFEIALTLSHKSVFQGRETRAYVEVQKIDPMYEDTDVIVRYTIGRGGEEEPIVEVVRSERIYRGAKFSEELSIPLLASPGQYWVHAEILMGRYTVGVEEPLRIVPLPIFDLGSGVIITYADILSGLGTIAFSLLFLLCVWLALFGREYWLYVHSLRHITERHLRQFGFWGERKGVRK